MSVEDWRKDERGRVIVHALLEYETTIGSGSFICLRMLCLNQGDTILNEPSSLQLVLTPHQTALLGTDLLNAAAVVTRKPQGSEP